MNNKKDVLRLVLFFALGAAACLLSYLIGSFMTSSVKMTQREAVILLTPICEEVLKAVPIFFFALVFKPKRASLFMSALAVGFGFAALNAVIYVLKNSADDLFLLTFKVITAITLHVVCAVILGYGLSGQKLIMLPGSLGLLCAATAFHSMYNLFVLASGGIWQIMGYILPMVVAAVLTFFEIGYSGAK